MTRVVFVQPKSCDKTPVSIRSIHCYGVEESFLAATTMVATRQNSVSMVTRRRLLCIPDAAESVSVVAEQQWHCPSKPLRAAIARARTSAFFETADYSYCYEVVAP